MCVCVHECVRVQYDAIIMQSSQQKSATYSNKQISWHGGCVCVGEGVLYYCKCVYCWCVSECVNKCERQRQCV